MGWNTEGIAHTRGPGLTLPLVTGVGAALLLMFVSLSSIASVRSTAHRAIDQEVRDNLSRLAGMIASTIDGDAHAQLTAAEQEGGALYRSLNRPLTRAIARTEGVRFIYTLRPVGDKLCFVLDGTPGGDADRDGVEDHSALMEVYKNPDPAAWSALDTGSITVTGSPFTDAWGTYLSGFAPVRGADGTIDGVIGVDVSAQQYQSRLAAVTRAALWALLPGSLMSLAAGLGAAWVTKRLVRYAGEIVAHREDAIRANDAKSSLLANISHELRTPLNAIVGFITIAEDDRSGPMERADAMVTVKHNAEHLLTLVNDLLDVSKAEAGVISIERTEIDLPELIERAVAPLRLRAMEKRIGFVVDGIEELPPRAVLDRTRVRQVLLNLLSNAVKFTDTGSVHLRVSAVGGTLSLCVTDTGPGMSGEDLDRLFTPFTQLGSIEKRCLGTGLGLTISHHLTELMGGTITVRATPGKGSVFTVEIPYGIVDESSAPASAAGEPMPMWERLSGVRVAIAEDCEDSRRLLRLILRRAGAQTHEFSDGESARAEILRDPRGHQLLITDWDMPILNGEGLVRKLRESGWVGPIISLTAHASTEQEGLCLSVGCDAHLTKPLDAERLIETSAALIAQHGKPGRNDQGGAGDRSAA